MFVAPIMLFDTILGDEPIVFKLVYGWKNVGLFLRTTQNYKTLIILNMYSKASGFRVILCKVRVHVQKKR